MPALRRAAALLLALAVGGCASMESESTTNTTNRAPEIDPMARNWQVETLVIGPQRYAIALTKRYYATGGDGEAMQVFRRQAERLAAEQGYGGFEVIEYSEGIESKMPIAQRVSRGVVELR